VPCGVDWDGGDSVSSKKPIPPPVVQQYKNRPTSPPPPRKRIFPPITLIGVEALAVGEIVDQLENTIRLLLSEKHGKRWQDVSRTEIEFWIAKAERHCIESEVIQ